MSHSLVEIPSEQWPTLRAMYDKERQYSCSYNMLHLLITRVKDNPTINAHIYSLDGDWEKDGLFIAFTFDRNVCFNILTRDSTRLTIALSCLDQSKPYLFFGFQEKTKPLIMNLFEELHLKPEDYDHSEVHWHHISKETVNQWEIIPAAGFTLKELHEKHADQINSVWPHRSAESVNFVKVLIKKFPNIGTFDKDNKLIAWCLMLPTGALGLLQVETEYQKKGFGSLVVKALAKKFVMEGFEVVAPVVTSNTASLRLFKSLGFKIVDRVFWQFKPALEIPLK